jgi:hypothetical protein
VRVRVRVRVTPLEAHHAYLAVTRLGVVAEAHLARDVSGQESRVRGQGSGVKGQGLRRGLRVKPLPPP